MSKLSHLDKDGKAKMVDVSDKADTEREAGAEATIFLSEEAFTLVMSGDAPKGDVLAAARLAGIMAAKKNIRAYSAVSSARPKPCRNRVRTTVRRSCD